MGCRAVVTNTKTGKSVEAVVAMAAHQIISARSVLLCAKAIGVPSGPDSRCQRRAGLPRRISNTDFSLGCQRWSMVSLIRCNRADIDCKAMTWVELMRRAIAVRSGPRLLLFTSLALLGIAGGAAVADETSQAVVPQFSCEIRYHFRERLEAGASDGKKFSAPAVEREALPRPNLVRSDGKEAQVVEGKVAHLPYRFAIKLMKSQNTNPETLEVGIFDSAGEPLSGYPQTMVNPFANAAGATDRQFKIPIPRELAKMIEKTLLAKNQLLTGVDLSINY